MEVLWPTVSKVASGFLLGISCLYNKSDPLTVCLRIDSVSDPLTVCIRVDSVSDPLTVCIRIYSVFDSLTVCIRIYSVFDWHFSNKCQCWASFRAGWPSRCLLWRSIYLGFLPIFLIGLLLFIELYELFIYLEIKPLLVISFVDIFSQSIGCFFPFV